MSSDVPQILVETPDDEPRSRLEPYRAQILRWRNQGRSYRRIQKLLSENWQVRIAYESLRQFVQRRSRPRKEQPEVEAEQQSVAAVPAKPQRSAEEIAAVRESARSVNQPMLEKKPDPRPRFVYDPSKPPVNKNYV